MRKCNDVLGVERIFKGKVGVYKKSNQGGDWPEIKVKGWGYDQSWKNFELHSKSTENFMA